jgi:hypothetical protein
MKTLLEYTASAIDTVHLSKTETVKVYRNPSIDRVKLQLSRSKNQMLRGLVHVGEQGEQLLVWDAWDATHIEMMWAYPIHDEGNAVPLFVLAPDYEHLDQNLDWKAATAKVAYTTQGMVMALSDQWGAMQYNRFRSLFPDLRKASAGRQTPSGVR